MSGAADWVGLLDADPEAARAEIVVDAATGRARQAGSLAPEGRALLELKALAERSLYYFTKAILGRHYLNATLHRDVCDWLQRVPPNRKLLLLPRYHCKTTIVAHALPVHILIQPEDANVYFPGEDGSDQRVLLCGESELRAKDALRVIQTCFETNEVLRAFWPHRCWEEPRRQAKKWNDRELIIPRATEWPDPSLRAVGVDGAITGAHPSVLCKDDLISLAAANSPTEMDTAIQWHTASRALIPEAKHLEFCIGTRWAVFDLYSHIIEHDATVEVLCKGMVEDGRTIYPEKFPLESVEALQKEYGVLFPLLFMNSAADPLLADFDLSDVRSFEVLGDRVRFAEDERDVALRERMQAPATPPTPARGTRLTEEGWQSLWEQRRQGVRVRYG